MISRFVDRDGLRPARSVAYENQRQREIDARIDNALNEDDVLLASIETFHMSGKHDQSSHGRGGGDASERPAVSGNAKDVYAAAEQQRPSMQVPIYMRGMPGEKKDPADEAIHNYTSHTNTSATGYREINGGLRGTRDMSPETADAVKLMDEAFDRFSVTNSDEIVVERVIGVVDIPQNSSNGLMDAGFMSTSTRPLDEFGRHGRVKITIPPGTRMLSGSPSEDELIVDRGSFMVYTGSGRDERGSFRTATLQQSGVK